MQTDNYALYTTGGILDTLNASDNYWGTSEEGVIQQKIYDFNDLSPCPVVKYWPFRLTKLESIGI